MSKTRPVTAAITHRTRTRPAVIAVFCSDKSAISPSIFPVLQAKLPPIRGRDRHSQHAIIVIVMLRFKTRPSGKASFTSLTLT
jgi:hypothetical protein